MHEHYHIPMEDLMAIEVHIANRQALDELAKSYQFDDNQPIPHNLQNLAQKASSFLNLSGKTKKCFLQYFVEKNIPIQVNFKPLKVEQLHNMIEEWLSLHSESSTIIEKLYSNNHRNLLFKRVLFEERDNIDDYFKTLSEKLMLRGVDLYQLLVDILSPYHLYEFDLDSQTFFQKVNSLNSFLAVVNRFIHSQKRIAVGINSSDCEYVRRFQFDRLIEFWEQENNELILLSEKRKNHFDKASQTIVGNVVENGVQTQKRVFSLPQIINETMNSLNKLTPLINDVHQLESIQRLYSMLRKEKLALLQTHEEQREEEMDKKSQKTEKIVNRSPQISLINLSYKPIACLVDHFNANQTYIEQLHQVEKPYQSSLPLAKNSVIKKYKLQTLRQIYNIYFGLHSGKNQLMLCLDDIGVHKKDYQKAVQKMMSKKGKLEKDHVSFVQFENVIEELMGEDKDLTGQVLEQFLRMKVDSIKTFSQTSATRHHPNRRFTPYTKYL